MDHIAETRPTGEAQRLWAIICAAVATLLIIIAMFIPTRNYDGTIDAAMIALRFWLLVTVGALFQIALLCALTAVLLRAIWHLPAKATHDTHPTKLMVDSTISPLSLADPSGPPKSGSSASAAFMDLYVLVGIIAAVAMVVYAIVRAD